MPSVDTFVIDPEGADFDLSAWDSNHPGYNKDLVAADKQIVFLIKGPGTGAPLDLFEFTDDWVVDADHYITVKAHPDHAHAGVYNSSKARFLGTTNGLYCLRLRVPFTRIGPGLIFEVQTSGVGFPEECIKVDYASASDNPTYIDGCIFKVNNGVGHQVLYFLSGSGHQVTNCLSYSDANPTSNVFLSSTLVNNSKTITVYNCTHVDLATDDSFFVMVYVITGTVTTNNCYFGSLGSGASPIVVYDDAGGSGVINKGANDATYNAEAATAGLRSLAPADCLTDTTFATFNGHLKGGSPLIDTGAPIGAVTSDFEGDTRVVPYDIGADEVPPPPENHGYVPSTGDVAQEFMSQGPPSYVSFSPPDCSVGTSSPHLLDLLNNKRR